MLRQALRHIEEGKCQVADGSGRRRRGDFFFPLFSCMSVSVFLRVKGESLSVFERDLSSLTSLGNSKGRRYVRVG